MTTRVIAAFALSAMCLTLGYIAYHIESDNPAEWLAMRVLAPTADVGLAVYFALKAVSLAGWV